MSSYYSDAPAESNSTLSADVSPWYEVETREEVECHRCYGTGDDDDGLPCDFCGGDGTLLL